MRELRYSPIRLPQVAAFIIWFDGETSLFYHVCPPPDKATPFGYLRSSHPPSTSEGTFSHHTGVVRPSTLRVQVYVEQQGHMQ